MGYDRMFLFEKWVELIYWDLFGAEAGVSLESKKLVYNVVYCVGYRKNSECSSIWAWEPTLCFILMMFERLI